jgi:hypothetical protein
MSLFLAAPALSVAQNTMPMDSSTGRVTYEAVFDAPGTKDDLFARAQAWFTKFYPNPSGVISATDPEIGKIEADAKFQLYIEDKKGTSRSVGFIKYDLKIWVKDGKVRYKITDIRLEHSVYYGIERWMDPMHEDAENNPQKLSKIADYVNALISDFTKHMTVIEVQKNEDDW